mgnify:FL=1
MNNKQSLEYNEEDSALISLFAIHKTGDPDKVVRETMASVLKIYTKRVLSERLEGIRENLPLEKIHQLPDDVGSPHETEHDKGWNDCRKAVLQILQDEN